MKIKHKQKSLFNELKSELVVSKEYIKGNLLSAAELRFSFIMQVLGMMVNNVVFFAIWIFFFQAFGKINGWSTPEVLGLQGFIATVYGLAFCFCTGVMQLPTVVQNGSFDSVLLTPRSLYFRILTLTTQPSAVGDAIYGFILLAVYVYMAQISFVQLILLVSLLIPAIVILINFALVTSCLAFFIPDADDLAKNAFELMFGPSMYPSGLYQGATRAFFLIVLPSIAVGGLPVEAVKDINLLKVLLIWGIAIAWILFAIFILKQSIKKYESGNLTGARI